jgi:hypothetical protein
VGSQAFLELLGHEGAECKACAPGRRWRGSADPLGSLAWLCSHPACSPSLARGPLEACSGSRVEEELPPAGTAAQDASDGREEEAAGGGVIDRGPLALRRLQEHGAPRFRVPRPRRQARCSTRVELPTLVRTRLLGWPAAGITGKGSQKNIR